MGARRDAIDRSRVLGEALKALRRRRGLTVPQMARAMAMGQRTYEALEAGARRLDTDEVHRAAGILRADPYALLAAAEIHAPAFAVRSADHQLMSLVMLAVQEFDAAAGDDIALLDPATILYHLTRMFDALAAIAAERRALLDGHGRRAPRGDPGHDAPPDAEA